MSFGVGRCSLKILGRSSQSQKSLRSSLPGGRNRADQDLRGKWRDTKRAHRLQPVLPFSAAYYRITCRAQLGQLIGHMTLASNESETQQSRSAYGFASWHCVSEAGSFDFNYYSFTTTKTGQKSARAKLTDFKMLQPLQPKPRTTLSRDRRHLARHPRSS